MLVHITSSSSRSFFCLVCRVCSTGSSIYIYIGRIISLIYLWSLPIASPFFFSLPSFLSIRSCRHLPVSFLQSSFYFRSAVIPCDKVYHWFYLNFFSFFLSILIGQLFIGYRQLPWERQTELLRRLRLRSSCGSSSSSCRCRPCKYRERKERNPPPFFFFFFIFFPPPRSSYFPPCNSVASHPVATHRAEATGLINRGE